MPYDPAPMGSSSSSDFTSYRSYRSRRRPKSGRSSSGVSSSNAAGGGDLEGAPGRLVLVAEEAAGRRADAVATRSAPAKALWSSPRLAEGSSRPFDLDLDFDSSSPKFSRIQSPSHAAARTSRGLASARDGSAGAGVRRASTRERDPEARSEPRGAPTARGVAGAATRSSSRDVEREVARFRCRAMRRRRGHLALVRGSRGRREILGRQIRTDDSRRGSVRESPPLAARGWCARGERRWEGCVEGDPARVCVEECAPRGVESVARRALLCRGRVDARTEKTENNSVVQGARGGHV